jgi:hypothetical protein
MVRHLIQSRGMIQVSELLNEISNSVSFIHLQLYMLSQFTDPRAERSFYMAHDKWYPTWKRPTLDVDFIKIFAI